MRALSGICQTCPASESKSFLLEKTLSARNKACFFVRVCSVPSPDTAQVIGDAAPRTPESTRATPGLWTRGRSIRIMMR